MSQPVNDNKRIPPRALTWNQPWVGGGGAGKRRKAGWCGGQQACPVRGHKFSKWLQPGEGGLAMGSQVLSARIWGRKPGRLMFLVVIRWQSVMCMALGPWHTYLAFRPSYVQHALGCGVTPGSQPAKEGIPRLGLQE